MKTEPEDSTFFLRLFMALPIAKIGFMTGHRSFTGLDEGNLKGHFKGILLSTISRDVKNGVFPFAICVCESENIHSWRWLLRLLKEFIGEENKRYMFMSDRPKGIIGALELEWLGINLRLCVRHIDANFRRSGPQ
ncbi:hypothetical protein Patl1_21155 [Pistacia atlantica]|uniref:Uncharacterized protein n=1 Tax=Pistacia atlantica TaxID=434234 RepID=A0ACC1BK75_9ROSI|nr:hypothetical protein Patl1_21155 [Pistacia atlantica]